MPESDISKMKVADLKRELKLRGLTTTGNKTELQDRLQTALIDGEISLEDTAISGEDLLDEDAILTDEDEAKIFGADENELLKSPTTTPTAAELLAPLQVEAASTTTLDDDMLETSIASSTTTSKKIVLKRKSITLTGSTTTATTTTTAGVTAAATATADSKEATAVTPTKTLKMSERNPITIDGGTTAAVGVDKTAGASAAAAKVSQLSLQERLDMRAKKFGISAAAKAPASEPVSAENSKAPPPVSDEKQLELLKKRAERFGCVLSSKIAKIDAEEKLQKRQQRFGSAGSGSGGNNSDADEKLLKRQQRFGGAAAADAGNGTATGTSDAWAEKARLRLERFKASSATNAASADSSTAESAAAAAAAAAATATAASAVSTTATATPVTAANGN